MGADNLVSSHERPAVGMELGGSNVELGQELPLKTRKGNPKFDLLKRGGVDEAEGGAVTPLIISANWLTGRTRPHNHFIIMLFAEGEVCLVTPLEANNVKVGVDGGGLAQQGCGGPRI